MPVAELFLAAFIGMLFDRLTSPELLNFVQREGLGKKLDKWSKMLKRMEAVLDDADEKQYTETAVKDWLDDLRDLAYDVEDILDEFATKALRQKLAAGNQASTSKVRNLIPTCCTSFTPSAVKFNMRLGSEIEKITARFNEMVKQKDDMKLSETVGRRSCRTRETLAPTSVVTKAHVYGREKDKEALLEFLVGEKRSGAQLSVIPIIGMGGVGKTTLTQLVYNDKKVQNFFDLQAWAHVSQDFDANRVTKAILQSLTSENCDGKDLNWLQNKLKKELQGKKFLVVMDDLWNENYHDWTILRVPFKEGAPGSAIVITTRNKEVALKVRTTNFPNDFPLNGLSNEDCLSILAHHALDTTDLSAHPNLKDIGERIVGRCKGSPLAAEVLGGVLHNKVHPHEWDEVSKSNLWDRAEVENEITKPLMLSYHDLPSNLKRCFAYCSILPKSYEFEEKQMVLLWMAEGLLQPREERKQMEDLGREYFRNLYSRSFFQQSFKDESRFVMHDLINDLAQQVAGDICFRMEDRVGGNNDKKPSRKARHSSYLGSKCDGIQKFEVFKDLTCLRTFLPFMLPNSYCNLTRNVPFELLPKLRRLRVLSLNGYQIYELPESIGDLKHLRFFDLSHTQIRSLPESIGTLYNLQTLILEYCSSLKKLPSTFENLVNLRHLYLPTENELEGMLQIGKLTHLQTLPDLIVGKDSCSGVKVLGPLLHLQGTLCISRLENVVNHEDASGAMLSGKQNLNGLSLKWSKCLNELQDTTSELEVFSMLKPHEGLKELTVSNYGGTKFPIWLSVPSFSNMVLLRIKSCAKCTILPPVGQLPSLKELFIEGMASVKNIGREFYGECCLQPFRSLETLHFESMKEWENWIPCEEFPKLHKLSITSCPKLSGKLPKYLPLLENIVINDCRQLVVSISSFQQLCKVEIEGSEGVVHGSKVDFSSLRFSGLSTISEFTCQIEEFIMEGLANVEDLTIEQCEEMTTLLFNDVGLLQQLSCLGVLEIRDCSKLVSLVEKKVEEQLQLSLPSKLRAIMIKNCGALESLPKAMMYNNMHLEEISIDDCSSLTHFAIGKLPPTLKRLMIRNCQNIQILVDEDDINSCGSRTSLLEYLNIWDCPSLKYLTSSGELPATLRHLEIGGCEKLESIAKSFRHNSSLEVIEISYGENLKSLPMGIHSLSSLQELKIRDCPNILSFPELGFPTKLTSLYINSFNEAIFEWGLYKLTSLKQLEIHGGSSHLASFPEMMLPASLTGLNIQHFPNLECMSSKSFQFLASLEKLWISRCEKLMSFLDDGLPLSLRTLVIQNCEKLTSFPKFGLSPSLTYLEIYNCKKLTAFPKDGLPPSLRNLYICYCEELTSFPKDGLPPSLTSLTICFCEGLTSFPEFGLSPSLAYLQISNCKKLTSFPEDRLPLSLLELDINNCPQLIERCEGREWFKIAHIPKVIINCTLFYKPEEEGQ